MNTKATKSQPDFEKSLAELEKIVQRMEQGEQTLEQSIKDFEQGMALSQLCQKSLQHAEQRVEKLIKKHDRFEIEPVGSVDDTNNRKK